MFCIPPGGVSPSRHTACAFVVGKNYRLQDIQLSKSRTRGPERGFQGSPRRRKAGGLAELNKVENTGLEPVTSWLQTRRSPS